MKEEKSEFNKWLEKYSKDGFMPVIFTDKINATSGKEAGKRIKKALTRSKDVVN